MEFLKDSMPLCDQIEAGGGTTKKGFVGILYECNDDGWGNPVLKEVGRNTVVIGGAILALEHLCNAAATWKPDTLNTQLGIEASTTGDNMASFIFGFCVGKGGAALDFGSVKKTDLKQRNVEEIIPLRSAATLAGSDAAKYFLKKDGTGGKKDHYAKEFAEAIIIKSCWKDAAEEGATGTEITEEIYNSTRTEGIETFAEFTIGLNIYDVREYWESISQLDMARYNTLGLLTGQKVKVGTAEPKTDEYVNVRLFSVLNFDNKAVKEKTTATYKYRVYSLV